MVWKLLDQILTCLHLSLFNGFEFFGSLLLRQKLRRNRVGENDKEWRKEEFCSWNNNEEGERNKLYKVYLYLSDFDRVSVAVLRVL
jgi:hypothetical protein